MKGTGDREKIEEDNDFDGDIQWREREKDMRAVGLREDTENS